MTTLTILNSEAVIWATNYSLICQNYPAHRPPRRMVFLDLRIFMLLSLTVTVTVKAVNVEVQLHKNVILGTSAILSFHASVLY